MVPIMCIIFKFVCSHGYVCSCVLYLYRQRTSLCDHSLGASWSADSMNCHPAAGSLVLVGENIGIVGNLGIVGITGEVEN